MFVGEKRKVQLCNGKQDETFHCFVLPELNDTVHINDSTPIDAHTNVV